MPRWVSFAFSAVALYAAQITIDPAAVNNPAQEEIAFGASGSGVLRAQILLARAHFSCGEIDGRFGSNLQKAVSAFQEERKLPVTGTVDAATWKALQADVAPALISYTVTPEDLKDPFVPIPATLKAQAKLSYLGYASALEEMAEKFHSSPDVLRAINPDEQFRRGGPAVHGAERAGDAAAASGQNRGLESGEFGARLRRIGCAAGVLRRHHR